MTAHGDDDAGALGVCNTLAGLYRAVGVVDRAIPLYEQTLVGRERVLGDDHPDTITARNNLVDAYQAVGDLERVSTLRKRCG
ncbi:tetratricopeptide repeat protein [Streptomyces sp. BR1]|uniref:tetratricopeptide repeat protein n=1 Tax=Streptomyces sp. BR1 TaxID=1592323 RepID=UPI00402B1C06